MNYTNARFFYLSSLKHDLSNLSKQGRLKEISETFIILLLSLYHHSSKNYIAPLKKPTRSAPSPTTAI